MQIITLYIKPFFFLNTYRKLFDSNLFLKRFSALRKVGCSSSLCFSLCYFWELLFVHIKRSSRVRLNLQEKKKFIVTFTDSEQPFNYLLRILLELRGMTFYEHA